VVVDDEQLIADTLALILNRSEFSATAAYSGEEAVEVASVLKPDILISDVIMFEMTGIDLAIHAVKSVPGCRVLCSNCCNGKAETIPAVYSLYNSYSAALHEHWSGPRPDAAAWRQ
jgi:CheY-like chemotaxis protein